MEHCSYKKLNSKKSILQRVFLAISLLLLCSLGCKRWTEVEAPATSLSSQNVFRTDATAIGAVTNLYAQMCAKSMLGDGLTSLSFYPGLSSDEFVLFNSVTNVNYLQYYQNSLLATSNIPHYWNSLYYNIYLTNLALEGLTHNAQLTVKVRDQLLGEVHFFRAFSYFYLVNLYGDVPLAISSDYKINANLPRAPKELVYSQIISDLKDAQTLLSLNYLDGSLVHNSNERVRLTKWAATAMLSRVYLYIGDYENADKQSTSIISNSPLYDTVGTNQVFIKNNKEAIWQLQPVLSGINTQDARLFIIPSTGLNGNSNPISLRESFYQSFEENDLRKKDWVGSFPTVNSIYYYPQKYKISTLNSSVTEYTVVLRLAEQYLIRAESRAQREDINGSIEDLNVIRKRAGLLGTSANSKALLLSAIIKERQLELFSEWGHRWLDLKRTGLANEVLGKIKGENWKTTDQLYPIPQSEIDRNPSLRGRQNLGYN